MSDIIKINDTLGIFSGTRTVLSGYVLTIVQALGEAGVDGKAFVVSLFAMGKQEWRCFLLTV